MSMQHKRKFPVAVANVSAVMEGDLLQTHETITVLLFSNLRDDHGVPVTCQLIYPVVVVS